MTTVYRQLPIQLRWADFDANNHLLHSRYYDFGAFIRMQALNDLGLAMKRLSQLQCAPVLYREEAVFKKEICFNDEVFIDIHLLKARPDYARWSFIHQLVRGKSELCATITVEGSFIDPFKRKAIIPPEEIIAVFEKFSHHKNFVWIRKQ